MNHSSILIIDDDKQLQVFLRQVLEEAGYRVTVASNGQEGLCYFRKITVDLVITDLFMPERDGLEVTIALHRESPTVKIIILTGGSGDWNYLDAAKLLGAHRTMKKPVTVVELLKVVQEELLGYNPSRTSII